MNPTLFGPSSFRSSTTQQQPRHKRNISTDSCDYEKLPTTSASRSRTSDNNNKKHVSKSSVTEDAKKVLDRFLKHLTPDEERLLRNYFGADSPQDEHTYVSYVAAKEIARSSVEDSNDVYQSFRQFQDKEPVHHHYYDIDQSTANDDDAVDQSEHVAKTSASHAEEYISRLCLGHGSAPTSSPSNFPPIATEDDDHVSSSSTEDYEFPDKELLNRKKKSTFRLALERVQQSFKRQKAPSVAESPTTRPSERFSTPHKKRHPSKKSSKNEERVKDNKNFFDAIINQLKRKGFKLGRKPVKDHRSRSADNLNTIIRPLRPEQKKLLERYRQAGYDSDNNREPGDREPIDREPIDREPGCEFLAQRPRMPLPLPHDVIKDGGKVKESTIGDKEDDDVDGGEDKNSSTSSIIPFNMRTAEEKEELFGKIADQLAAIADNYKLATIWSREEPINSAEGAAGLTLDQYVPVRNATQSQLNAQPAPSPSSIAAELVGSPSYSKFEEILSANVGGGQTGWGQVAFVFRLTRSAVHLAGMGTSLAGTLREFTIKYFEERFASWIVDRGGWESMVEDGNNTELNSELD